MAKRKGWKTSSAVDRLGAIGMLIHCWRQQKSVQPLSENYWQYQRVYCISQQLHPSEKTQHKCTHMFTKRRILNNRGTIHNNSKLENIQMLINSRMEEPLVVLSNTAWKKYQRSTIRQNFIQKILSTKNQISFLKSTYCMVTFI